jgi:hypothetical protein
MGKTWQKITTGLPAGVYVHVVTEDPCAADCCSREPSAARSFIRRGRAWQPLHLNLPVTSVRDFEIYNNDLIVATHGRGFWVIDDISPLRQINEMVLAANAFLFKPSDAINYAQGGDNGTPLQKDEPQALNPPNGAVIDYYLKTAATGPVVLEILDASGATVATFATESATQRRKRCSAAEAAGRRRLDGGIPNTSALWRYPTRTVLRCAGMHRVVWNPVRGSRWAVAAGGGGGRGGGGARLTGTFTAKLTANGQTLTQIPQSDPAGERRGSWSLQGAACRPEEPRDRDQPRGSCALDGQRSLVSCSSG